MNTSVENVAVGDDGEIATYAEVSEFSKKPFEHHLSGVSSTRSSPALHVVSTHDMSRAQSDSSIVPVEYHPPQNEHPAARRQQMQHLPSDVRRAVRAEQATAFVRHAAQLSTLRETYDERLEDMQADMHDYLIAAQEAQDQEREELLRALDAYDTSLTMLCERVQSIETRARATLYFNLWRSAVVSKYRKQRVATKTPRPARAIATTTESSTNCRLYHPTFVEESGCQFFRKRKEGEQYRWLLLYIIFGVR